jgi:hypothetical protein
MQLRIAFFAVIFLLFSCQSKQQPNVLSMDKMSDIITDIQLADASYKLDLLPEVYKNHPEKYYLEILAHHQTDSIAYNRSMQYYAENPILLKRIYQKVEKNIAGNTAPPPLKSN